VDRPNQPHAGTDYRLADPPMSRQSRFIASKTMLHSRQRGGKDYVHARRGGRSQTPHEYEPQKSSPGLALPLRAEEIKEKKFSRRMSVLAERAASRVMLSRSMPPSQHNGGVGPCLA